MCAQPRRARPDGGAKLRSKTGTRNTHTPKRCGTFKRVFKYCLLCANFYVVHHADVLTQEPHWMARDRWM